MEINMIAINKSIKQHHFIIRKKYLNLINKILMKLVQDQNTIDIML